MMVEEARQLYNWCIQNELYEESMLCLHRIHHLQPELEKVLEKDLLSVLKKHIGKLEQLELWDNIARCFQKAFTFFPNCANIHYELGCFLHRTGNSLVAVSEFKKALSLSPNNLEIELCLENAKSQAVDQWHFRMLNDRNRNECYRAVINQELQLRNCNCVLDIGTGTGILAMIAIQKCDTVYACDSSSVMFNICSDVLKANDLIEDVILYNKSSLNLSIPNFLPSKVDLVITEVFDAGLLGENVLTTLNHAWENLLLPPQSDTQLNLPFGRVIPYSATVLVCLVECEWLRKSHRLIVDNFGPVDLSSLTIKLETDEPYNSEYLTQLPGGYKRLSKPVPLCNINFNDPSNIKRLLLSCNYELDITCTESGIVDCVALWFNLELDDHVTISTAPEYNSCWEQAIYPVTDIVQISKDDRAELKMTIKDHISMNSLTLKGSTTANDNNIRTISLKSEWIRKLNCSNLASCLQSSLEHEFQKGNFRLLDHETVPLAALLATRMNGTKCTITNKEINNKFYELCTYLELPTNNIAFLDVEELCEEMPNTYNTIFFDPVQLSGAFHENVLQDVALLKQNFLHPCGSVYPNHVSLFGMAVDCPAFSNHWRVNDENVLNFKIADVINSFQTRYQEDVHYGNEIGTHLTNPVHLMRFNVDDAFTNKEKTCSVPINEAGIVTSLLYWAEMEYTQVCSLNMVCCNDLYSLGAFSPLLDVNLEKNDELRIRTALVCSVPQFHIEAYQTQKDS